MGLYISVLIPTLVRLSVWVLRIPMLPPLSQLRYIIANRLCQCLEDTLGNRHCIPTLRSWLRIYVVGRKFNSYYSVAITLKLILINKLVLKRLIQQQIWINKKRNKGTKMSGPHFQARYVFCPDPIFPETSFPIREFLPFNINKEFPVEGGHDKVKVLDISALVVRLFSFINCNVQHTIFS